MTVLPEEVRRVLEVLERAGQEAWCVGGAVRDLLLGKTPEDWDVTTNAPPERVAALFPSRSLPTGLKHGTVTVLTDGGRGVEVTTFRRDGAYADCRRPDRVEFVGSLEEDLARRDFTVNAMALNLRGELADPWGGRRDLEARVLRAVGEPGARFREDALRILRALRFSSRLGFAIEPDTSRALISEAPRLLKISSERVYRELEGILCGEYAGEVLLAYPRALGVVLPEILPCVGFDQHTPYHCYDVWEHTVRSLEAVPPQPVLRLAMLFHDIGKPETFTMDKDGRGHFYDHWRVSAGKAEVALRRLKADNHTRSTVVKLVELHDTPLPLSQKGVRRRLAQYGEEMLRQLLWVKRGDALAHAPAYRDRVRFLDQWEALLDQVLAAQDCFSLKQLAVKGGDLTELGLRGPAVGEALRTLLERVVDGVLPNEREALLRCVREEVAERRSFGGETE